ncbi:MAG: peptidoglycan-binding domain-containing protein [Candidatus Saccharimonadales bacterium]
MTNTYADFARDILQNAHLPSDDANVSVLVAVMAMENSQAKFNPTDTTQPMAGDYEYNSVGVRDYPTWTIGVAATVITLQNGYYPSIIECLSRSDSVGAAKAWDESAWGTHGVEAMLADAHSHYDTIVAGSVAAETPITPDPAPPISNDNNLTLGATGQAVISVQLILNGKASQTLKVDGIYGPATQSAVENWQRFWDIPVDGIVGSITRESLWVA